MSSSTTTTANNKKDLAWKWTKPIPGDLKYFLCGFCDDSLDGDLLVDEDDEFEV